MRRNAMDEKETATQEAATIPMTEDEDAGAGVVGAKFFGGNKEKEQFYDANAEAKAAALAFESSSAARTFDRFADRVAFDSATAAALGQSVQTLVNEALSSSASSATAPATSFVYDSKAVQWETPMVGSRQSKTPLLALQEASDFYRRIHVAVTSVRSLSDTQFQLRWEIGVGWPIFWEPSVLLTGASTLTVQENRIVGQVDVLDEQDLVGSLVRQILPRFWDMYHVGMTPSAEVSPAWERKLGLVQNFLLYQVPSRWMWAPTLVDRGEREDGNASFLPNHAFTTAIRTMGPKKDEYIPTLPTQVEVQASQEGANLVTWKVPLAVNFQAQSEWPLMNERDEDDEDATVTQEDVDGTYVWQPARQVASLPTGIANPQDAGISDLRKRLYERVLSAGLKPALDASGRPRFFFWSSATKTCYTEAGLGMAVYEWRPGFAQSNEVGMELEETAPLSRK
jgi:hypothetical protein